LDENRAVGMDLKMQERKKLTIVRAQAYLKAGKTRKLAMLDGFCEKAGCCRKHTARVLQQAGHRYPAGTAPRDNKLGYVPRSRDTLGHFGIISDLS